MNITYWLLRAVVHAQSNIRDEYDIHNAPLCSPVVLPLSGCTNNHLCCKEEQKVSEKEKRCFGERLVGGWLMKNYQPNCDF